MTADGMLRGGIVFGLCMLGTAPAAQARENRVLKCNVGAALHAPASGGPALVADVPRAMTPIALDAVQMTDRKLARRIVVEALFAQRSETDALQVMARLVNCTDVPVIVQARSSFLDRNQMPTEPSSVWKTVFLSPRATGTYQENSIGRTAVANYLIELRADQ